jgi:dTDP-4-dehydrorhamnose 3,5-epimerase
MIQIPGVGCVPLIQHTDGRGWLCELWRSDGVRLWQPEMAYLSLTKPGQTRGPHEHREQTDYFAFFGNFDLVLWDCRNGQSEPCIKEIRTPMVVIVPPGVVHAYTCVGPEPGITINLPDQLYRRDNPDEIRHEHNPAFALPGV